MCETPFLSIIIPVYNTRPYLTDCLDSILNQPWTDYEILLIDDGSSDGSAALCDEYASRHSQIRCHHQPNSGHTAARQQGYRLSRGEYVTFVDSDDWISPDMYPRMCQEAQNTHADILLCNYIAVMPNQELKCSSPFAPGFYDKDRLRLEVYPSMIYSGAFFIYGIAPSMWNKIFRRSLLEKHLLRVPHEVLVGEDALASYSCMLEASSIYFFDEAFYYYRSNAGSATHSMDRKRLGENHILFETLYRFLDISHYPALERQLHYYIAYQTLLTFIPVFRQISEENSGFRDLFRSECTYPQISKAFSAVKIGDINGIHNRVYAFCIRHKLYLLFKFLLKH
ncbi:MAG: glycosyltransferase [Clostridiales bacterium]|nr:glycosyltransferase [Clostridiales bacterium]